MSERKSNHNTNAALESLDWDLQPERDLWPDIHSNIRFSGKPRAYPNDPMVPSVAQAGSVGKKKTIAWLPLGIAACFVFAFGAFVLSSLSYRNSLNTYEMQASFIDYQKSQISLIEQQHAQVRAQFVALLNGDHGAISPSTVSEIQAVLLTIDQASFELKEAILAEPLNKNYAGMLARTYQEELKLLNRFKALDGKPSKEISL